MPADFSAPPPGAIPDAPAASPVRTLIEDARLKVGVVENASDAAILCFTGVGHAVGGVDIQSPEFLRASRLATALFVIDRERSWGNAIDFAALQAAAAPYIAGRTVNAIGNSMGGFLAVLASRFFRLSTVVAFVPQFSVSPRLMPGEPRWRSYVQRIAEFRFESLEGCFRPETTYYILSTADPLERQHWSRFPQQANLRRIVFADPAVPHDLALALKGAGLLYPLIDACLARRDAQEIVRELFASGPLAATVE